MHDPPPAESRNDPTATAEPAHEALFAREYEQELEGWLRRRVRIFCLTLLVLSSLSAINVLVDGSAFGPKLVSMIDIAIGVIAIVAVMTHRKIREGGRSDLLRLASIMILILGGSSIASAILRRIAWEQDATITLELFGMHLLACLLLPWRPAESVRPFVPLLLVSIAYKIGSTVPALTGDPAWMLTLPLTAIGAVLVAALAVAPGLLVCWYRMRQHSESFRVRMVGSHFVQLRRELTQARRIHEGMFPEPFDDGRVRFRYLFRPMRELGGDFIHLHQDQRGATTLVLLDVTGHGLAAALTVNRLQGELDRIRGERPDAGPREILGLLNRYVAHTMAGHDMYVTAACAMIDPDAGELRWANAGHPPGFLKRIDGRVDELDATAVLLGALPPDLYEVEVRRIALEPGDELLVYTDGAFEVRDRTGRQLGLAGLRSLIAGAPPTGGWIDAVASVVDRHRAGPVEDDVLVASLALGPGIRTRRDPDRAARPPATTVPGRSIEPRRLLDERMLERAARLAVRGHGAAEPNPLVGALLVQPPDRVVGWGVHRRFGDEHAEIEAIRRAGPLARGATCYVTLEPCSHHGKTPPCVDALVEAGVGRVVVARADPHAEAGGGAERLRAAGIEVEVVGGPPAALRPSDAFVRRLETDCPWVIAKWAQTVDGRIATRAGTSQWISSPRSRAAVHRERGRVDAILTGIGTVLADDPRLTARIRRPRRLARRVVVDPKLQLPLDSALVRSADAIPVTVACHGSLLEGGDPAADRLREAGVELIGLPPGGDGSPVLPLGPLLRHLAERHDVATVLVEAGAGLLGRLLAQDLVDELWIFQAPLLLGDEQAMPSVRGRHAPALTDGLDLECIDARRRGPDLMLRYRVRRPVTAEPPATTGDSPIAGSARTGG